MCVFILTLIHRILGKSFLTLGTVINPLDTEHALVTHKIHVLRNIVLKTLV